MSAGGKSRRSVVFIAPQCTNAFQAEDIIHIWLTVISANIDNLK